MGPGPSNVSERVLAASARPTIGHLDPNFVQLMDEIKTLTRYAFQTDNALTFPVSAPGSAGMEMCVVNLVEPGDKVIVCINGVFGGRLKENVERAGGVAVAVEDPWGRAVDPDKVRETFKAHPDARILAFVHAETSTGACSDVAALCGIAREHDALTIVDTVTSLSGVELRVDDWGVDAAYSGSQKCLSCPPGLSPVTFSERAVARMKQRKHKVQSWFLDLSLVIAYWEGDGARAYHHTAPVNAMYAMHEALLALHDEGLEAAWQRHRQTHEQLREGLESLGFRYLVPAAERLPQLNSVYLPDGVADEAALRRHLLDEHHIEIGAGLGALAGKIWRIGLMGHTARSENVERCLAALKETLA
ncbi:MAG: alanine--glyoxylate aminotransferase family protein [Pseudomonadota bacterium]